MSVAVADPLSFVRKIAMRCALPPLPSFGFDDMVGAGLVGFAEAQQKGIDPALRVRCRILDGWWAQRFVPSHAYHRHKIPEPTRLSLDRPLDEGDSDDPEAVLGALLVGADDKDWALSIAIAVALRTLTPREELAVRLRYWHGLTESEIGRRLGVSQTTIYRMMPAILAKLRWQLEDH